MSALAGVGNRAAPWAARMRHEGRRGGRKAARSRSRSGGPTKAQFYKRAKARGIEGRSKMSKRQLQNALG